MASEETFADPTAPSAVKSEAKHKFDWVRIKVNEYFNVRNAPNLSAKILCLLTINMHVMVEDSGKPWLRVKHERIPGGIGYVSSSIMPKKEQDE